MWHSGVVVGPLSLTAKDSYVSPVDWHPVQSSPCFAPNGSWVWLQHLHDLY